MNEHDYPVEEDIKSRVYIKVDEKNRIIRCEGGYTTPKDLTGWIEIDKGYGDKYNLCQTHYFPQGLTTMDFDVPLYEYINGKVSLRSQEDIKKDELEKKEALGL